MSRLFKLAEEVKKTYDNIEDYYKNLPSNIKQKVDENVAEEFATQVEYLLDRYNLSELQELNELTLIQDIEKKLLEDIDYLMTPITNVLDAYDIIEVNGSYDEVFNDNDYIKLAEEMIHNNTLINKYVEDAIENYIENYK